MKYFSLIIFLLVSFSAAFFGSRFPPGEWYQTINKPSWTPPSWVFGPVWTFLYIAISFAGWLVWQNSKKKLSKPLVIWIIQMTFNATWSWLFFGLKRLDLAFVNIVLMLSFILAFIKTSDSKTAFWLFVPYALWVSFAALLNYAIWQLN